MRILAGFGAVIVLGMVTVIVMAVASPAYRAWLTTPAPAHPSPTPPPAEYELAVIQGTTDTQTINRLRFDLDTLSHECIQDRDTLADQVVTTRDILAKGGISASFVTILDATMRTADSAGGIGQHCDQYMAAYATLRLHGYGQ